MKIRKTLAAMGAVAMLATSATPTFAAGIIDVPRMGPIMDSARAAASAAAGSIGSSGSSSVSNSGSTSGSTSGTASGSDSGSKTESATQVTPGKITYGKYEIDFSKLFPSFR